MLIKLAILSAAAAAAAAAAVSKAEKRLKPAPKKPSCAAEPPEIRAACLNDPTAKEYGMDYLYV